MNVKTYMGFELNPSSYQDRDMPGYWFPLVVVAGQALVVPTRVALPPEPGLDEDLANEKAMREAVRRIKLQNL